MPHYEHDAALMVLSPRIAIPRREDCTYELPRPAAFLGISMYTDAYAYKAEYLRASGTFVARLNVRLPLSLPRDAFLNVRFPSVFLEVDCTGPELPQSSLKFACGGRSEGSRDPNRGFPQGWK